MTERNIKWPVALGALGGAWLLFAVAIALKLPVAWLGLPLLLVLPGWLLMQAIDMPARTIARGAVYSVGLTLALLLGWGWLCNALLPLLGVAQPLGYIAIQIETHVLVAALFALAWRRTAAQNIMTLSWSPLSVREFGLAIAPLALIAMAATGAFIANNGGGGWTTFIMLVGAVVYAGTLIAWRDHIRGGVIAWGLYGTALALLLMTSLRSWFIAGHDIQQEFYVFQLTKDAGIWSMGAFRDAYNACLSITTLPTQFAHLLQLPSELVFKVVFPAIFALVPVAIYLTVRRFASRFVALLGVLYFMAVPTFFADMPMLNRQMIAFLFMALTIYALFDSRLQVAARRVLAIVFGVGMIVAHYSTTYLFVGILAAALILRWLLTWLAGKDWAWKERLFARSSIIELRERTVAPAYALDATVVVALIVGSLVWSLTTWVDNPGQLTTNAFNKVVKCVSLQCESPERSSDVGQALFGAPTDFAAQLEDYRKDVADPGRDRIPQTIRYPQSALNEDEIKAISPETPAPSALSEALNSVLPLNVVAVKDFFHGFMVRLVQVLVIVGGIAVIFWDRFGKRLPTEYTLLALVSLLVVVATVLVPGLSVRYGVFRAFEQALIVAGPLVVIGSMVIFSWMSVRRQRIASAAVALIFLATTLGIAQFIFGGGAYQYHFANKGTYHDLYYTHKSERQASLWLSDYYTSNHSKVLIQMDSYMFGKWRNIGEVRASNQSYPSLVRKNSYVLLSETNVHKKTSTIFHNGTLTTYQYPVDFLDDKKDLLYNNGGARVYR